MKSIRFFSSLFVFAFFIGCGDSSVGPSPGDKPSLALINPSVNGTLSGIITVKATAKNIESAKFYVGENLLAEISEAPYEIELNTREYANGSYDIRVEATSTSINDKIKVQFENYLATIHTNGWLSNISESSRKILLFVADPSGKILRKINLHTVQGEIINLLPPELLPENGAPKSFSLTTVQITEGESSFYNTTYGGFESWSKINWISTEGGTSTPPDSTTIHMNIKNLPEFTSSIDLIGENKRYAVGVNEKNNELIGDYQFVKNSKNLIIAPYVSRENRIYYDRMPMYYWEKQLTNNDRLVIYSSDFMPMKKHEVSLPNISLDNISYNYSISVNQNNFDSGSMGYFSYPDMTPDTPEFEIFIPETNHKFMTSFRAGVPNNNFIYYSQRTIGDLPTTFDVLDYNLHFIDKSLDNLMLQVGGQENPETIIIARYDLTNSNSWLAILPDSTEHWVYPRIADSLEQNLMINYDRNTFSNESSDNITVYMVNDFSYNNYLDYLKDYYLPFSAYIGTNSYTRKVKYVRNTTGRLKIPSTVLKTEPIAIENVLKLDKLSPKN